MTEFRLDIQALKALLLEKRAALQDIAASAKDATKPVELDQTRVEPVSRIDAMQAQAMANESDRRRQLEAKRIAAALARMDEEEYGSCLTCGDQIAEQRLGIDPAAILCISCAASAEAQ